VTTAAVAAAEREMERRGVPGASIAFIEDRAVSSLASLGVRSVVTRELVTERTVYEGASHGKPLFAYAVVRLADDGVLPLDEPIGGIEDGVDLGAITPRMILAHTSGIGNWTPGSEPVLTGADPGARFEYSTTAFRILQHAAERITGRPLDDLMREHVYERFGLRDTSYLWRDGFDDLAAQGHDADGTPLEKWKPRTIADSASGVHTTARDLATYVAGLLTPDDVTARLFAPQITVDSDWGAGPPRDTSWALGWGLTPVDGDPHVWHWGWNDGFRSFSTASLARGHGVVVLTNGDNGLWVCAAVVTELLGAEHPAFPWLGHG
jgi:CubicO group peptidase (beta-lactamase class C family)